MRDQLALAEVLTVVRAHDHQCVVEQAGAFELG